VEIGPVAAGGACVARLDGRVVFVRHALPGERVRIRVTDSAHPRYWRADAIEVLTAAPDRVEAPCRFAGDCGGCDWQHVSLGAQRALKADLVREQLRRVAGLTVDVVVEAPPGDDDGLGWRTRTRFAVDAEGRPGLRRRRSHDVVASGDCLIAHPLVVDALRGRVFPGAAAVDVAVSVATGRTQVRPEAGPRDAAAGDVGAAGDARAAGGAGDEPLVELAAGHSFTVAPGAFWQVHPAAPGLLVDAVLAALDPRPGETVADLYGGVGLFAAALADRVGAAGRVILVESDPAALASAAANLAGRPGVSVRGVRVTPPVVRGLLPADARLDLVVLDPPRAGAGVEVMTELARRRPRAIAYVSCDPATLARDVAGIGAAGYELSGLRAFDLFPMTAHVECLALLTPAR
jgi:tRNA/tmRNA/rRNA uracil-C5-methylase (TrmA/RlmC/RlmD family)